MRAPVNGLASVWPRRPRRQFRGAGALPRRSRALPTWRIQPLLSHSSLMKNGIATAAFVMAPLLVKAQAPSRPGAPAKTRTTEAEVRDANTREVDAFLASDASTLERLWSSDMVVTNPLNKFV